MSEERKSSWVTKYGVPSLALSIFVFVLQQQQQTFDRVQRALEGGWQFYSGARTPLQYADDVDRELSLLKVIGNAFPNVYCDVRQDIWERAWAARPADTAIVGGASASSALGLSGVNFRTGEDGHALVEFRTINDSRPMLESSDLDNLQRALQAGSRPPQGKYPESILEAWFPRMPWTPTNADECPSLNGGNTSVAKTPASAAGSGGAKDVGSAPAAAPAKAAAEPLPPPASRAAGAAASTAPADGLSSPIPSSAAGPSSPPPAMAVAPTLMRVFFHVPSNSTRDGSVAANARNYLSAYNYRVMRGVERVAPERFPKHAEVRFFGPDEAKAAKELAEYLNYQYRAENLTFDPKPIGVDFPNMPRQNLEVWVPNP